IPQSAAQRWTPASAGVSGGEAFATLAFRSVQFLRPPDGQLPTHSAHLSQHRFVVDGCSGTWFALPRNKAAEEPLPRKWPRHPMNEQILQEISEFCRRQGLAESTFGRRAVNDGKLAARLRNGGRITTDTLDRIRAFMVQGADDPPARRRILFDP